MELQVVVERYAQCLAVADQMPAAVGTNRRTKQKYQPGIQPMTESAVVPLLAKAWRTSHPGELILSETEAPYAGPGAPSAQIDHVFSTDGSPFVQREWGIEFKRLQFVGDNGKNGDHETAKMLSPYLKDRGVLHDALRLRAHGFTRRVAVIGYGFDYDEGSLDRAAHIHSSPAAAQTLSNLRKVVRTNGPLLHQPLIEFADAILRLRGWTVGPRAEARFEAWRHPSGGLGVVFGWEIRRPEKEPTYDPRHPW